ncbi:MAG TPA: apolipoprotein N-acyltransferase [Burkholderiaceae bacterium]|nr:apolipoprotein N-acyltransferase [Burkholderiaceae bacterium]
MVQSPPTGHSSALTLLLSALAGLAQGVALAWPWGVAGSDWVATPTVWDPLVPRSGQPWPVLQIVAMAVWLVQLVRAPSWRMAFLHGWVFGCAALVATFWWLFISMHTYGGLAAPLAAVAVLALAGALALYVAVVSGIFWRLSLKNIGISALFFASLWCLAELARGVWFTGFPWGASGYAHVNTLGWLAPWVGVYGMGAVAAGLAMVLARAWLRADEGAVRPMLVTVTILGGLVAGPAVQQALPSFSHTAGSLPLVLLQGNIAQDEKFQSGSGVPHALALYARGLTRQPVVSASAEQGAAASQARQAHEEDMTPLATGTLVVAPETALPLLPQQMGAAYWQPVLSSLARQQHAVVTGLPLGNLTDGYANAVWGITPQQAGHALQRLAEGASAGQLDEGAGAFYRYDKHHLVPFGEFIPPLFRWFVNMMNIPLGDFNRGALNQPSFDWTGQRIAPNICYEDLFGEELASRFVDPGRAPTILVNLSNLAWFGNSVAIDQHLHISRLRALELERPMVRATNTGATVVIDHQGRVTHALPRAVAGELQATVEGREGLTPYARWAGHLGLGVLWLLAGAGVLAACLFRTRGGRPVGAHNAGTHDV